MSVTRISYNKNSHGSPSFLRRQILSAFQHDQRLRKRQLLAWQKLLRRYGDQTQPMFQRDVAKLKRELEKMDRRNTKFAKSVIRVHGWPSRSLVGKRCATAFFLLVQHADHDLVFQKKCLGILKKAARIGEAQWRHFALLYDRVLIHERKKQLYGTQFQTLPDGTTNPFPIARPKFLNSRRRSLGMNSFKEECRHMRARNCM